MNATATIAPGTATPSLRQAVPGALTYNDTTHVYMLESQRCRSITNIAKIPTDDFTVNQWRHKMAALGFILDPTLLEDIAAHRDDSGRVADIVQKAIDAAGGSDASRRGTQAHAATEYHDLDQPLLTEQQRNDASVWQRTLDAYGITIEPAFVEQIVLYPGDLIAGRIDRFAWMDGCLFDFDTKTGTSAWRYPHGTAVQLALHVAAPWMQANSLATAGIETITQWQPLPEALRRDIAYIISMPTRADADLGTLYRFDLAGKFAGHMAREAAIVARHFQLRNDLATRIDPPLRPAVLTLDEMRVIEAFPASTFFDATAPGAQQVVLDRIMGLSEFDKAKLRGQWQAEMLPSIGSVMPVEALVRAWELVDLIDPFAQVAELDIEPRRPISEPPPPLPVPDDGDDADPEKFDTLRKLYMNLPDDVIERLAILQHQAQQANVSFHLMPRPTVRNVALVAALVMLAVNDCADDESIRTLVAGTVERPIDERYASGAQVGALDHAHAKLLWTYASAWVAGDITCAFDDDGTVHLTTTTNKE